MKRKIYTTVKVAAIALIAGSFTELHAQTVSVTDEAGLRAIATQLDGTFQLQNDITLTGEWEPIGDNDAPFTGTLDGNGHVIKNLTIAKENVDRVGFFGVTNHATITKVGFENVNVTVTKGGSADVGVIIGKAKSTTISESYVAGGYLEGRDHVGAIAGGCGKDDDTQPVTSITDCYAALTILTREYQAGGLVGTIDYTSIDRCYFSGTVENLNLGGGAVAGIAGFRDGGGSDKNAISNSVTLAPYVRGGNVPGRILGNWGAENVTMTNNHALTTTQVSPSPDGDHVADGAQGADVEPADVKTAAFYSTTLGWDLTNVWTLHAEEEANGGIYPVLKWQTDGGKKATGYVLGAPTEPILVVFGNEVRIESYGSLGQKVTYTSSDDTKLFVLDEGGTVTFLTGEEGMQSGSVTATASSAATSYLAAAPVEIPVTVKSIAEMTREVATPTEFSAIRDNLELYYVLKADIDLSAYENFDPIGTADRPFTGRLSGEGHKITGLKITGTDNLKGLFGYAKGATFKEFTLENPEVSGNQDIGALLGKAVGTQIEKVAIIGAKINGEDHVGTFAGKLESGTLSTITNSYATGAVLVSTAYHLGGLVGVALSTTIEKTYFSGTLENTGINNGYGPYYSTAGGFIGFIENADVTINNSLSLAYSITSPQGEASAFVGNGDDYTETNSYYLNIMSIVTSEYDSPDFAQIEADKGKPIETFTSPTFYTETLGWDFTNVWGFEEGTLFPVLSASGSILQPTLTATPPAAAFGDVPEGTTATPITITVAGANLTGDISYALTGADADAGIFGVSAATGWSDETGGTLTVTFAPTAIAAYTATLTVSGGGATDVVLPLTGSGVAATDVKTVSNDEVQVYALEGNVRVKTPQPVDVVIYDITGRAVQSLKQVTNASVPLAKGVYLVKVGATSVVKVLNK